MNTTAIEIEENTKSFEDYAKVLKRRLPEFFIPFAAIAIVVILAALLWPATYESTATILIQEQEIPREFVQSTLTGFAAQQVQVIRQRILTVESINKIADKFSLYRLNDGNKPPDTEVALRFRQNVSVDLVSADVIDPRSGRPTEATIAFKLGYQSVDPNISQRVANELVTLFLDENQRLRTKRAANTTNFLDAESTALNQELIDLEGQLARFKEANEGNLPELYQFNLSTLERNSREVTDIGVRIKELAKRETELSAQISQLSPTAAVLLPNGEAVLGDVDRLKILRSEFRSKSSIYRSNHPDLVRLNREIAELEASAGVVETQKDLLREIATLEGRRTDLARKFATSNPRIASTTSQIEVLKSRIAGGDFADSETRIADNPAYVFIDTQLMANVSERKVLEQKQKDLQQRIETLERQISRAPEVEKQYQALVRQLTGKEVEYSGLIAKQGEAERSENLEQEQRGEQYLLIEPPALPFRPSSPNRKAIVVLGLLFAFAFGIGFVALREMLDASIHGDKELTAVVGVLPFAVIPYIENGEDVARRAAIYRKGLVIVAIGSVALLLLVHVYIRPLDVVWSMLINRLTGS